MKAGHDSQIILYCKRGWFKRGVTYEEQIEDLKTIIAETFLLYRGDVDLRDIRTNLVDIVFKYQELHNVSLMTFIDEISPEKFYQFAADRAVSGIKYMGAKHPDYDFDRAVIMKCMGIISTIQVRSGDRRLLYMDPPDFSILPPYDADTVGRVKRFDEEGQWA